MRPLVVCAAVAALLAPAISTPQDVTAPALKAAFIDNFARFTEWPESSRTAAAFVICVLGDTAVGEAIEGLVAGRDAAGRPVVVSVVAAAAPKDACHILYVSGATTREAAQVAAGLRNLPVLTIGDGVGFIAAGGMVRFFFERGQLRFNINVEAVKRSGLRMSSRLLVLAQRYD